MHGKGQSRMKTSMWAALHTDEVGSSAIPVKASQWQSHSAMQAAA